MAIRLILIDVDGTLVGRDGVHASTWDAVERARARGVALALCTGRVGRGAALAHARRVAPDGLHVFQSGAVVSRPGQPAEFSSPLPPHALPALAAVSRRERVPLEAYGEARFFLEFHDELTRVHATHLGMEPEMADFDALPEPPLRAQWVVREADWPRYRDLTLALGGLEAHPATAPWSPGTVFSNLVRVGTSKSAALRWLATRLGLAPSQVAMVGDAENDLDALEAAGLGIVMGSAPAWLKARAGAVVAAADDGGLAQAIDLAIG